MNLTAPITLAYLLIVILMITVVTTGYAVLINKRVEMIYLLRPYTYRLESGSDLTGQDEAAIEGALGALGLTDVRVSVEHPDAEFGQLIGFTVTGQVKTPGFSGFLQRITKKVDLVYHRDIVVKRIVN